MRFRWIDTQKAFYPLALLCRLLRVSRSGYYAWKHRPPSKRVQQRAQLDAKVRAVHAASRGTYGAPRVHAQLRRERPVSRKTVARSMRRQGLFAHAPRRFRKTTDSNHAAPIAPNVLQRDFTAQAPNVKWAGDITYIETACGWLYLAVVLDLYSRRVVGWAAAPHLRAELPIAALRMALGRRGAPETVLHHSDRGCQYASRAYRAALPLGAPVSMSRRGNCWDNAPVESFFATLKKELVHRRRFGTHAEARYAICEYIELFYNPVRLHSSLDYRSPAEYETHPSQPQPAALAA